MSNMLSPNNNTERDQTAHIPPFAPSKTQNVTTCTSLLGFQLSDANRNSHLKPVAVGGSPCGS